MFLNDFGWNSMTTQCVSMIPDEITWTHNVFQWFQMDASRRVPVASRRVPDSEACKINVRSRWDKCEVKMRSRETNVRSMWDQCEIDARPMRDRCDTDVRSMWKMWGQCEIYVKSMWDLYEINLTWMWVAKPVRDQCEIHVRSMWD